MISITRGDTKTFKFQRKNSSSEVITEAVDKMYITFKKTSFNSEALFQKTLENGITYDSTTNYYSFTIEPSDTNELSYGEYVFDIEIIKDDKIKTILKDTLEITKEVTFASNEV